MSLSDWAKNDWLKAHKTSEQEIEGLLSIVGRELKDAQVKGTPPSLLPINEEYRHCDARLQEVQSAEWVNKCI